MDGRDTVRFDLSRGYDVFFLYIYYGVFIFILSMDAKKSELEFKVRIFGICFDLNSPDLNRIGTEFVFVARNYNGE